MFVDDLKSPADAVDGEGTYGFLTAADTKSACIEASACGFKLYERLAPIEKTAFFGWNESGEIQNPGYSGVSVLRIRIQEAQSGDCIPLFRMVPA